LPTCCAPEHSSAGHPFADWSVFDQREGWTVLAYTWGQVVDDPEGVAAEIEAVDRRLSPAA
jgi:hypothetical protein